MELNQELKKIAEFWLGFEFLKKFSQKGEQYMNKIKEERNGFKQTERAFSGRRN